MQILNKHIGSSLLTLEKYANLSFDSEFPFLKDEYEFSTFRKKLIGRIERHLDIEFPDNLLKAMTKMNDLVNILSSTNESLTILEPDQLDIEPGNLKEKTSVNPAEKVLGFLNTTPTDFFDVVYNS